MERVNAGRLNRRPVAGIRSRQRQGRLQRRTKSPARRAAGDVVVNDARVTVRQEPCDVPSRDQLHQPGLRKPWRDQYLSDDGIQGCPWTARSNVSSIRSQRPPAATATVTVEFRVAFNSQTPRAGELSIANQELVVTQAGQVPGPPPTPHADADADAHPGPPTPGPPTVHLQRGLSASGVSVWGRRGSSDRGHVANWMLMDGPAPRVVDLDHIWRERQRKVARWRSTWRPTTACTDGNADRCVYDCHRYAGSRPGDVPLHAQSRRRVAKLRGNMSR